ncbi:hypothetical protein [Marispirochaeta aestuarii]|uniref:hypothetical protein n=1 Tax=Marispirochaeta aestuarii TaxID=1963862 RepID=UPI0029C96300|nr:hypothetical protein [Marispirochaeta aestuarii]
MSRQELLFSDNFQEIPLGMFSANVGPHTEYHFREEAAPKYGWGVACFFHDGSKEAWHISERNGRKVMRQTFANPNSFTHPIVSAGNQYWTDYILTVLCAPSETNGRCGCIFRYSTNRRYYYFGLTTEGAELIVVNEELKLHEVREKVLGRIKFSRKKDVVYKLEVSTDGKNITCSISTEGEPQSHIGIIKTMDDTFQRGKIALISDIPADFLSVEVTGPEYARSIAVSAQKNEKNRLEQLRSMNPKPRLWKKIATPGFGVGRNLRFGDLDGDGKIEILVPQVIQHGPRDAYAETGCITAINLSGDILWRHGKPDPEGWYLTNDVAVQVHDVDGDGAAEIVYCSGFEMKIVEGSTGRVLKKIPTPESCGHNNQFPRILGDSIFFCDVRGLGRKGDILLKDRYWNFWVYDQDLKLLWKGSCKTGHYPYAFDIDGDGKDEIAIGYSLYDDNGDLLWSHDDLLMDHSDGVAIVNLHDPLSQPDTVLYAASDEGVLFLDINGTIRKHHYVGHAQNPAILKLRPDLPGLQTVAIDFWGNQGILNFFDADGNIYHTCEPNNFGSMCLPVNWRGDGQEYFLHSTNCKLGGMFDGWGRPVVVFPDDGHPDLCNAVLDLTGDCRDEIVTWNQDEIWIYTQDDNPKNGKLYKPLRNPQFNNSNYQASVSIPGWTEEH